MEQVAGLVGERWLKYLDSRWQRDAFMRGAGRLLLAAPYARPSSVERLKALELTALCSEWLKGQPRARDRGSPGAPRRRRANRCGRSPGGGCCSPLPLPWLVRRLAPADALDRDAALKVPVAAEFTDLVGLRAPGTGRWRLAALWAIWSLAVLAAARPQFVGEPVALPMTGRDLLMISRPVRAAWKSRTSSSTGNGWIG